MLTQASCVQDGLFALINSEPQKEDKEMAKAMKDAKVTCDVFSFLFSCRTLETVLVMTGGPVDRLATSTLYEKAVHACSKCPSPTHGMFDACAHVQAEAQAEMAEAAKKERASKKLRMDTSVAGPAASASVAHAMAKGAHKTYGVVCVCRCMLDIVSRNDAVEMRRDVV